MSDIIELIPGNSLLTTTPEEGRHFAIELSRLIIKVMQQKEKKLRPVYATDAATLIAIWQTVAIEFNTIAQQTIIIGKNSGKGIC